jgi:tellurite resistance protein TerC
VLDRVLDTLAPALRASRKLVIPIAGANVLAAGVLMLVLPRPAFVVIPAGLAILGVEFAWAHRWLLHVKESTASERSSSGAAGAMRGADASDR